ncbi:MAG: T9SS type A sorting domain-containing protein [Flavobacteriales bacterium]|nr:T9SS type A sorting domain-containing protein [Flavobacteriales bacterium]
MKKLILTVIIAFTTSLAAAQNWAAVGEVSNGVYTLYTDTVDNVLYIGGSFTYFNGDTVFGIVKYDGSNFYRMGCGLEWDCSFIPGGGNIVVKPNSIVRYNNEIYIAGNFTKSNNVTLNGLARWDGSDWQPCGTGLKNEYGGNSGGSSLKVLNNELYVCGIGLDSCAGVPANGIAKYNGVSWSAVHNIPRFKPNQSNYITDVEVYNGDIYVCGNFYDSIGGDIWRIARWNGSQWVGVDGGMKGGIGGVNKMVVYKGLLYAAGIFGSAGSNPHAKGIATWDGTKWENVGGGIYYPWPMSMQIFDMKVYKDKLYIVGWFSQAGGIPTKQLAVWDGVNWCSFDTTNTSFDNVILALDFYQDTLYIGGGFWSVDGDTNITYIAKYIGAGPDTCGNTTGINENKVQTEGLRVYPNPASNSITIEWSEELQVQSLAVFDYLGREVLKEQVSNNSGSTQLDVSALPQGMYFLHLQTEKDSQTAKFIKQ